MPLITRVAATGRQIPQRQPQRPAGIHRVVQRVGNVNAAKATRNRIAGNKIRDMQRLIGRIARCPLPTLMIQYPPA
jgi:hypothetical protein